MRELDFSTQATCKLKQLLKSNPEFTKKMIEEINHLCTEPIHGNTEKLSNYPGYKIRKGKYRIVYTFTDDIVEIKLIDHRKDIYRKLRR